MKSIFNIIFYDYYPDVPTENSSDDSSDYYDILKYHNNNKLQC